MKHIQKHLQSIIDRQISYIILAIIFAFILVSNIVGSAIWDMLSQYHRPVFIVSIAIFVISGWLIYRFRHELLAIHTSAPSIPPSPRRGLILFLSKSNVEITDELKNKLLIVQHDCCEDFIKNISTTTTLESWNWLQILRAIIPHYKFKLKHVYLICSKESQNEANFAEELLRRFLGSDITIKISDGIDFFDLTSINEALEGAWHSLTEKLPPSEIALDITGGPKIVSIAGALFALRKRILFQYVQTQPPYSVMGFEIFPYLRDLSI